MNSIAFVYPFGLTSIVYLHIQRLHRTAFVGLSNILDSELIRRKPVKRFHRKVVGAADMNSKLFLEVFQREEGMTGIKTLLILAVAALDLTIVPRRVGADQLVADAKLGSGLFKERRQIAFAIGKTIGKLETVVRLDAFYLNPMAGVPCCQLS